MYLNHYVPQLSSAAGVASFSETTKGRGLLRQTKDAVAMSEGFRRGTLALARRGRFHRAL